jgi:hypothetical protein
MATPLGVTPAAFAIVLTLLACGASGSSSDTSSGSLPAPPPGGPTTTTTTNPPGGGDGSSILPSDPLVGVFSVNGTDARGTYEGTIEVTKQGEGYAFTRTVAWKGVTVEDGRELHWVFAGTIAKSTLSATLRRADWMTKHGAVVRTAADGPVAVSGSVTPAANGAFDVTISGGAPGIAIAEHETWSGRRASDGTKLYVAERAFIPGHPPPSATEKAGFDTLYKSYDALPVISPFAARPEFKAAIHGNVIDKTDFDFYRAHPNAIRVAQKVVDDVSIGETLPRADAYRKTLAEKAAIFEADLENRFTDDQVGTVPHGQIVGGPIYESGDGALWTGTWVAANAFRYQVTGDAKAIPPLVRGLEALLTLQEITGDWAHFARTLRHARGEGAGWHAGTGKWAGIEWLEGGNNDMVKGLFYGYLTAWDVLCTGALPGYASYCTRILENAKHIVNDVKLASSDTSQSDLTNKLPSTWLVAAIDPNPLEKAAYQAQAEGVWTAGKAIIQATPVYYNQGTVDWSGTHLTFVGDVIEMLLAQKLNLGGDAQTVVRAHIDASHTNLEQQRFATWHLLATALGTPAPAKSPAWVDDARWRFREIPYPKLSLDIDRRIGSEFCMSPYPAVPWKNDFMSYPDPDRTQGLATFPLFEGGASVTVWMAGNDYVEGSGMEASGADYVHLYWFARKYGLFSATE